MCACRSCYTLTPRCGVCWMIPSGLAKVMGDPKMKYVGMCHVVRRFAPAAEDARSVLPIFSEWLFRTAAVLCIEPTLKCVLCGEVKCMGDVAKPPFCVASIVGKYTQIDGACGVVECDCIHRNQY